MSEHDSLAQPSPYPDVPSFASNSTQPVSAQEAWEKLDERRALGQTDARTWGAQDFFRAGYDAATECLERRHELDMGAAGVRERELEERVEQALRETNTVRNAARALDIWAMEAVQMIGVPSEMYDKLRKIQKGEAGVPPNTQDGLALLRPYLQHKERPLCPKRWHEYDGRADEFECNCGLDAALRGDGPYGTQEGNDG